MVKREQEAAIVFMGLAITGLSFWQQAVSITNAEGRDVNETSGRGDARRGSAGHLSGR